MRPQAIDFLDLYDTPNIDSAEASPKKPNPEQLHLENA
jgi:hypothetical protein